MALVTARDRLLDALRDHGQRVATNGRASTCPAHEDHNPSLSIGQRRDGDGVVVRCQAGCDTEDVLAALNLTTSDLFDEARNNGHRQEIVATYDYTDETGALLYQAVRFGPEKDFRQRRPDGTGWAWNLQGTRRVLYRLPAVADAVRDGRTVYVIEGEKDVHAVEKVGAVATTCPMGAGKWRPEYGDILKSADVVVVADRDGPGRDHARDVVEALSGVAATVRVVEPVAGKDAADHLAAGHGLEELVPVDVHGDDEAPADDLHALFPTLDWHELWAREDDEAEDWIVEPLIPARRLVSVYSAPKVGKSLLMLEVAAAIATGRSVLGAPPGRPRRVLYVDFENDPKQDIRERLKAMGYGPDDLDNLRVMSFPTLAHLDTHQGGQELLLAAQTWECEVVVIDTVSRAVTGEENSNDTWIAFYRHTGLALKRAGLTLVRLDHTGKDARKGQRGGSAKSGDVDAVWRLTKDTETMLTLTCEAHRFPLAETELTLVRRPDPLRHETAADEKRQAFEAKVARVMVVLDKAQMPTAAGRDRCRAALKERGEPARTDVLNEAIRRRRDGPEPVPTLFGTGPETDLSQDTGDSDGTGPHTDTETAGQTPFDLSQTDVGQVGDGSHPDLSHSRPTPEGWGGDRGDDQAAEALARDLLGATTTDKETTP